MAQLTTVTKGAIAGVLATFVVFADALPQEISLQVSTAQNPPDARNIADYTEAVRAIVWVMVHRFDLPMPRGNLEVHPTREGFEQALIRHLKIDPVLARSTAEFAQSAVGSHTVLVNAPAVEALSWPQRIELLAHEITHSVELTLANRPGLSRPQWLIEGFAEWMAFNVMDALGLDDLGDARARISNKVRELRRKGALPRLLQIVSFADWVEARKQYGYDGTYSLSFLAADFLVERRSLSAVADYFRRFHRSDNHVGHFSAAFGEDLDEFERALDRHLEQSLR